MERQLPKQVVFHILKHVPFKQRMRMALVSKVFAAEALAATDALVLQHTNKTTARTCLNDWIDRHGSQLTSLRLEQQQHHWQLLSLAACSGLQSLQLGHIQVSLTLSQGGSSLQLLSATTGLTRLVLVNVAATNTFPANNLMALTALRQLQQLEVDASGQGVDAAYLPRLLRLPSPLIPCLTQVTHLALHHAVTDLWALRQVSRLTGLNSLSIDASTVLAQSHIPTAVGLLLSAQDVLSAVQPLHMLTALCLAGSSQLHEADLQQPFSPLTALRRLELRHFWLVDPGLLSPLTDLEHFVCNKGFAGQQHAAVLAWVAQQQGLAYLDLSGSMSFSHLQAPAAAYSALTASSNLQHLDLSHCDLPEGKFIWQVVFAPHTRLPQLTCLKLNRTGPRLSSKSLRNMVRCCPALRQLDLSTTGYYEWEVKALTGLSGLAGFTGCFYEQRVATGVLSALTTLRALHLTLPQGGLHRRPLLPLTRLRKLESLVVTQPHVQQPELVLCNKSPEGLPPDVWRQLRDWAGGASSFDNSFALGYFAAAWVADKLLPWFLIGSFISTWVACFKTGDMLTSVLLLLVLLFMSVPKIFRYAECI